MIAYPRPCGGRLGGSDGAGVKLAGDGQCGIQPIGTSCGEARNRIFEAIGQMSLDFPGEQEAKRWRVHGDLRFSCGEVCGIDSVEQDFTGTLALAKKLVGAFTAETALPEDVIGPMVGSSHTCILAFPVPVIPTGIKDTVLVVDDPRAARVEPVQCGR
jgi:hypothetical protein